MATVRQLFRRLQKSGRLQSEAGVLLGAQERRFGKGGRRLGVNWIVSQPVPMPSFDMVVLVEAVCQLLLRIHRDAIRKGQRADGSGAQPDLKRYATARRQAIAELLDRGIPLTQATIRDRVDDVRRRVLKGRNDRFRGFDSGRFADTIRMSRIRLRSGTRTKKKGFTPLRGIDKQTAVEARASVLPPQDQKYLAWLSEEAEQGREFFFVEGKVSQAVDQLIRQLWDMMVEGDVRPGKVEALIAKEVRLTV